MKTVLISLLATLLVVLLVSVARADDDPPIGSQVLEPVQYGEIARLHTFRGIYLGSQPQPLDFDKLAAVGIKTVVSLRVEREIDWDEEEAAMEAGMKFLRVPFRKPEAMTDTVFAQVRTLLTDVRRRPMLVHCGTGNRVGAIWLAHRVLDDGLDVPAALAEARTIGLSSPAFTNAALAYIRRAR